MPTDDQEALIEACLRGEIQAFKGLVDIHRHAVFALCLSYTGSVETAEDMAQEAFIEAYLHLGQLADRGKFTTWLKSIAANKCRKGLRRKKKQRTWAEQEKDKPGRAAFSTEAAWLEQEERALLARALERLQPSQRRILTLHYMGEMSLREIARALELTPSVVKQRLYRGRQRVRDILAADGEGGPMAGPFSDGVVAACLERGRRLLEGQRWAEARAEYRRVTAQIAEHVEAHKGLALALAGETGAMLDDGEQPYDEKLAEEALAALREAYRLGDREAETAWALAALYQSLDRHGERRALLEGYGDEAAAAGERFKALVEAARSAMVLERYDDMLSLHNRALALPDAADDAVLTSYHTLSPGYAEAGEVEEWLAATGRLQGPLAAPLDVRSFHCGYKTVEMLRRCGRLSAAASKAGDLLSLLAKGADADEETRLVWFGDALGLTLRLGHEMGNADSVEDALEAAAALMEEHAANGPLVGRMAHGLGHACKGAGLVDDAIGFFEIARQSMDSWTNFMFLASLKAQKGDRAGSLEALKALRRVGRRPLAGGFPRRWFERDGAFAPYRGDAEFAALFDVAGERPLREE